MPVPASSPLAVLAHGGTEPAPPRTHTQLVLDLLSIAGLVLLGGVFAGLTLGLMGLDMVNLQVLSTSGSAQEQREARVVLNLLEKGRHWVLVVLLLGNVIVNETLPVFLSDFGGGLSAVLTSTLLIVIFGEIVPQAVCARYGLSIGAYCAPMVHAVMILLAPIAWPTAKLLDWCLGEEQGTVYRKAELKTFVSLHQALGEETLTEDEVTIIRAVLDLNQKDIRTIMTPIEDVYTLPSDAVLDEEGIAEIVQNGYSRIPVHEPGRPDAVLGMLLVKNLISYDPEDAEPVARFQLAALPEAPPELTLFDCLNYFQQGRSHMLLVSEYPGEPRGALGVVTLEDVIEEMIGREIVDEFDVYLDVHNKVKVLRSQPHAPSNAAKEGSWQPLIRGIIERRRKLGPARRGTSTYGLPAPPSPATAQMGKPTTPLAQNGNGANYGTLSSLANAPLRRVQIKRTATWAPEEGHVSRERSNSAVSTGDLLVVPDRETGRRLSGPSTSASDRSQSDPPSPPKPTQAPAKSVAETSKTANDPVQEHPEAEIVEVLSPPSTSASAPAPGPGLAGAPEPTPKRVTIQDPAENPEDGPVSPADPTADSAPAKHLPEQSGPIEGKATPEGPAQDKSAQAPPVKAVSDRAETQDALVSAARGDNDDESTPGPAETAPAGPAEQVGSATSKADEAGSDKPSSETSTPLGSLSRGTGAKKNKKKKNKRK